MGRCPENKLDAMKFVQPKSSIFFRVNFATCGRALSCCRTTSRLFTSLGFFPVKRRLIGPVGHSILVPSQFDRILGLHMELFPLNHRKIVI
jgi:hypothetical protein